jgi:hypothetical protein
LPTTVMLLEAMSFSWFVMFLVVGP